MKIIDISWPISEEMTFYKNRPGFSREITKVFEKDCCRESRFTIGSHTGTHIDAPAHFLQDGKTIDQLPLEQFVGKALVVDCTSAQTCLTAAHFENIPDLEGSIVLCKTRNSNHSPTDQFDTEFIYISHEAASFLVAKKVKGVGIDYLGVERAQPGHETHTTLLGAGIAVVEGLRLADVAPGEYFFVGVPLAFKGADGAPARTILIKEA